MSDQRKLLANVILWLILGSGFSFLYFGFNHTVASDAAAIPFEEYRRAVADARVEEVEIVTCRIVGTLHGGERFRTSAPIDPEVTEELQERGISVKERPSR